MSDGRHFNSNIARRRASSPRGRRVSMGRSTIARKAAPTTAADAAGQDVLVAQLSRDLSAVLRQTKEAHGGGEGFSADGDAQDEKRPVAHFGAVAQRLLSIVQRLQRAGEVPRSAKHALLLAFGEKFAACHEFAAAERFFYSQVSSYYDDDVDHPRDLAYVQAMYGRAVCQFRLAQRADPFVRFPGSLTSMLDALRDVQRGMESALRLVRKDAQAHSWVLLNGSVLVYSIARPLQVLGFEREIIPFFKWCILCLDSAVMLGTTKYILWRLQIYAAACECFEAIARKRPKKSSRYLQSARSCAEHGLHVVAKLRKEEELDSPLPTDVVATLKQAETIMEVLVARHRALSKSEWFGKNAIECITAVQSPSDRFQVTMATLEKSLQRPKRDPGATELLTFAVEQASQLLDCVDTGGLKDANLRGIDSRVPLSSQLILIHESYRHGQLNHVQALIKTVRFWLSRGKDSSAIAHELDLYEALLHLDQAFNEGETSERSFWNERNRYMDVARALRAFSAVNPHQIAIPIRAVMIQTAHRLWKEAATVIIDELDTASRPEDVSLDPDVLNDGVWMLRAIYDALRTVDFDGLMFLGEVCVRLCILLTLQQNRRVAIQLARDMLRLIDRFRDRVLQSSTHFDALRKNSKEDISRASFSFGNSSQYAKSDCHDENDPLSFCSRRHVGVEGTGSQLGSLYQELACLQVDLYLLLFKIELDEAEILDELCSVLHANNQPHLNSIRRSTTRQNIERALQQEFKKNPYALTLLSIQRLRRTADKPDQENLADECFKFLKQAERHERELTNHLVICPSSVPPIEALVPRPPVILMRSSTCIVVEIVPFQPFPTPARRHIVDYYMVFAKPTGAGTDVSLSNCDFPGTGEQIRHPSSPIAIWGLSPNSSYVFAVAAYDDHGEVIQGIGETSTPVYTVNPLPLIACYGYLAQTCHEANLAASAQKAAMHVYNAAVSKTQSIRPCWAANYFYRHALKRALIASWPAMLLNLIVQSIHVACHDEDGDHSRDGQIVSTGRSIKSRQVKVLEASKMIAIGLEVACAAVNHEEVRSLTFKGYRVLLPLLHLDDVSALTFAALTVYYQALLCIPPEQFDSDTHSIAARIAFELLRIARRYRHLRQAIFCQVVKLKILGEKIPQMSTELADMLDWIALTESSFGAVLHESASDVRLAAVAAAHPTPQASLGGKSSAIQPIPKPSSATVPVVSTPPASARDEELIPLPRLSDLIYQSRFVLNDVFKQLVRSMKVDRNCLAAFCKLCHGLIDSGDDAVVEEWITVMKVTGTIGSECKGVLKGAGLAGMLPDPALATPLVTSSPPNTSRSMPKTPRTQEANTEIIMAAAPVPESESGADDEYVYTWAGEICLIQSTIMFRKITKRQLPNVEVDCFRGPQYNCAFDILGSGNKESTAFNNAENNRASATDPHKHQALSDHGCDDSRDSTLALFEKFLGRISASCQLFYRARAWHGLQTALQHVINSIWHTWTSPETLGQPTRRGILDDLTTCVDSMLRMIDFVQSKTKEQEIGRGETVRGCGSSEDYSSLPSTHNYTVYLTSTSVCLSPVGLLSPDSTWIDSLVEYTIQALLVAKRWSQVVQIGKKYHLLSGGSSRFSEKTLPLIAHAQRQYLAEQIALVSNTQEELAVFTKAFHDAEAKKKKKKSRLVVEEVLTPEEVEFHTKRDEIERALELRTREMTQRRRDLEELERMQDIVSRTTNKCSQALKLCNDMLEKHCRFGEAAVNFVQIKAAFLHCIALSRQKRQRSITGKALQGLSDFLWKCGDLDGAVKTWNEVVDNAFNALRATTCWRDILAGNDQGSESGHVGWLVEGDGLWSSLDACVALTKLILVESPSGVSTIELARMAAATVSRIVINCSLPHPSLPFLYGVHRIFSQLWVGRDLLVDPERVNPTFLVVMLSVTIQVLLQFQQPAEAMPSIALYESLALHCFKDVDHVVNARRFRLESLILSGRFHDAFEVLTLLLLGKTTVPPSHQLTETLQFRDDKRLDDPSNSNALGWFVGLDIRRLYEDLLLLPCKPDTAQLVLLSVVRLAVELSEREGIEESNAPLRQSATSLAAAASEFFSQAYQQAYRDRTGNSGDEGDMDRTPDTDSLWVTLALRNAEAHVLLLQARIEASGGQFVSSLELCQRSIGVSREVLKAVVKSGSTTGNSLLSLSHRIPPEMLLQSSIVIARANILSVKSLLHLGRNQRAIELVEAAVSEAGEYGGLEHYIRHLLLLRVQALVQSGWREVASQQLVELRESFVATSSCKSREFVDLLRLQAFLNRSRAQENQDCTGAGVLNHLKEAEAELDGLLERDGWTGTDTTDSVITQTLYHPLIPTFVFLKSEIVDTIVTFADQLYTQRDTRASWTLLAIELGLKAANHSIKPLASIKTKLLIQKGVILKKLLMLGVNESNKSREDMFGECVNSLVGGVEESIQPRIGGHDRGMIRRAFMELADLYGAKLIHGKESEHLQAAFHYLRCSLTMGSFENTLFNSLELQSGTISNMDKLPIFVVNAILQQSSVPGPVDTPNTRSSAMQSVSSGKTAPVAVADAAKRSTIDSQKLLNYFTNLLRAQHNLPAGTCQYEDIAVIIHDYLVHNHSLYAKLCCLQVSPVVPTGEPEIKGGCICAQWTTDITPGLDIEDSDNSRGMLSLLFTLGTTRIEAGGLAESNEAIRLRNEVYATSPVFSKRKGLRRSDVVAIFEDLSRLRVDMEDEGSLTIDRSKFSSRFAVILLKIQNLFRVASSDVKLEHRGHMHSPERQVEMASMHRDHIMDTFGIEIPVLCSLDAVKLLGNLFHIDLGVNTAVDNALCYFLRDLLDNL